VGLCPVLQEIFIHGEKKNKIVSYTFSEYVLKQSTSFITLCFQALQADSIRNSQTKQNYREKKPLHLVDYSICYVYLTEMHH